MKKTILTIALLWVCNLSFGQSMYQAMDTMANNRMTKTMVTSFVAKIRFSALDSVALSKLAANGNLSMETNRGQLLPIKMHSYHEVMKTASGTEATMEATLMEPVEMTKYSTLRIREGGRTVGAGQVTEILK